MTGAIAPPTAEPLSKIATASPRCDFGNHSETVFAAPGQFIASPAPSRKRNVEKLLMPVASDVAIATAEYQITAKESPRLVPNASSKRPPKSWKTVYAIRKEITTSAKSEFDQANSVLRYGARTLRVWRSM